MGIVVYPPSHRNVYHDHDNCPTGKQIKQSQRKPGSAGRPRCDACKEARMEANSSANFPTHNGTGVRQGWPSTDHRSMSVGRPPRDNSQLHPFIHRNFYSDNFEPFGQTPSLDDALTPRRIEGPIEEAGDKVRIGSSLCKDVSASLCRQHDHLRIDGRSRI